MFMHNCTCRLCTKILCWSAGKFCLQVVLPGRKLFFHALVMQENLLTPGNNVDVWMAGNTTGNVKRITLYYGKFIFLLKTSVRKFSHRTSCRKFLLFHICHIIYWYVHKRVLQVKIVLRSKFVTLYSTIQSIKPLYLNYTGNSYFWILLQGLFILRYSSILDQ
jgi:hypothetical protein